MKALRSELKGLNKCFDGVIAGSETVVNWQVVESHTSSHMHMDMLQAGPRATFKMSLASCRPPGGCDVSGSFQCGLTAPH